MRMSRRAKRMAKHHKRTKGRAAIQLVSLMDIFTILVFFLLVNSANVQNMPSTKALQLPLSTAEQAPKETVVVMVNSKHILVQGREIVPTGQVITAKDDVIPALLEELNHQSAHSRRSSGMADDITIMGDREIPYLLLKKIMITCTQAHYTNISLAVMRKSATAS